MISPARSLMLKALGAAIVAVVCCMALAFLSPSEAHAQGESPSEVEERAEEATTPDDSGGNSEGEGSSEGVSGNGSGEDQPGQVPGADDQTQDAVDEASRGDSGAQGSVGEDRSGSEDGGESSGDGDGGFFNDIAVNMIKAIFGWIGDGIEQAADKRTEDLSNQLTDGRYMLGPPSNGLTEIYDDVGNFTKPIAIVAFLFLGLSMALRGANHDTAYAAQTGIPRIVTVLAGIAFMPEIIGVIADVTREIANAVIDEQAMQEGLVRLQEGQMIRALLPFSGGIANAIFAIIKLILGVLIIVAIAVRNLVFGLLYVVGPLAIGLYAFAQFADVAGAWLRGILACFVISILWAIEFGIGYRFVADPGLLTGGADWPFLPTLLSLGILWLAWKTPWWVFQWAFYSYSAGGGGGGGMKGAMQAVSLFKLFKK